MTHIHKHSIALCFVVANTIALSCAAFAGTISNREPSLQEIGYLPPDGAVVTVNPPPVAWLTEKDATSWSLQIATDSSFVQPAVTVDNWPDLMYTHTSPLPAGDYYWRYRLSDKNGKLSGWSQVRSFSLPESAKHFPRPSAEELRGLVPDAHPRMFMRPEGLTELRRTTDQHTTAAQKLFKAADAYLKSDLMKEPLPWTDGKWNVEEWRAYLKEVGPATTRMNDLAFAWVLSEKDPYGARAKDHLLNFASWDPAGPSSMKVNDEVGMPVLYSIARTYDWIYPLLSEAERQQVLKSIRARGEEAYDRMRRKPYEQFVFNSHFGRMWHFLGEAGVAFYHEIPEAEKWLNYSMTIFYGWYPYWGDEDGGWAEGIWYWSSYNTRVTWWLDLMRESLGIDGAQKPFFAHVADFPMYVCPPGNPVAGFGDFAERPVPGSSIARTVGTFALLRGNSAWQWYAEKDGAAPVTSGFLGYLRALRESPEAEPPHDVPLLKVFQRSGIATFNTSLTDAKNNIHLAMRCSEFGNVSHGHNDQNAIVMAAFGEPLLVNTGRRDFYGSPFCKKYYWQTVSHNGLLIDGKGQKRGQASAGKIVAHGEVPQKFAWAVGDATAAYDGQAKLYRRWTIFLSDFGAVVVDELETTASEVSILFHAREAFKMADVPSGTGFSIKKGDVWLHGNLLGGAMTSIQTDKYPVPLHKGIEPLFDEWHLTVDVDWTTRPDNKPGTGNALRIGDRRYVVSFLEVGKGEPNIDVEESQGVSAFAEGGKLTLKMSAGKDEGFNLTLDPSKLTVTEQ